ncbi:uncharacterized protein LOC133869255 [Alnus glutinosa]|uniref:uncharacterized protein LOC133869255 n=1 Tax=Alnus glutinosa TaxID=3517 RepID=UPI002D796B00|nr:uncharacterized protein LOC133869255 [Alnus glutinosa]
MDISSSHLENEGEIESLRIHISSDDASTDEDDPKIELDDEEEFDDKEDNGSLYEIIDGNGKVEEPKSGSTFSSLEEVVSYYRKYAKQIGFAVIRRGIKKKARQDQANTSQHLLPSGIDDQHDCIICTQVDLRWILFVIPLPLSQ